MAEDLATFGRKVAAAQGYSRQGDVDWHRYGEAARYAIGRGKGVPDPAAFATTVAPARRAAVRTAPTTPPAAAPAAQRRGIRIGRYEISRFEEPEARNRPHHLQHRSQRSSAGRYRRRRPEGILRRLTRRRRGSTR